MILFVNKQSRFTKITYPSSCLNKKLKERNCETVEQFAKKTVQNMVEIFTEF